MNAPHTIPLWPENCSHNVTAEPLPPRLEVWLPSPTTPKTHTAVIVCPGGGYAGRAPHEGEPFARLFAEHGFVSFVLHYRVAPHRHPLPLADACRAVRLVRQRAGEFNVDPHRIALMGFSAGGHLAATVGTQPDLHRDADDDLAARFSARPDRLILAYPVVSFVTQYHAGSAENLLGQNPTAAARRQLSNELHVTAQNPPVFLFHTADDPGVPVANSLNFAAACAAHNVPVALHVFPHGPHGVGLASDSPALRDWPELLLDWLRQW
jgi:acetyl esterase/lipase